MGGQWKFLGGEGYQKPEFLKESMGLNWNFQRGGGIQTKKPSVGGVWIFSGTAQYEMDLFPQDFHTNPPQQCKIFMH